MPYENVGSLKNLCCLAQIEVVFLKDLDLCRSMIK
jgi:hypothetical protein